MGGSSLTHITQSPIHTVMKIKKAGRPLSISTGMKIQKVGEKENKNTLLINKCRLIHSLIKNCKEFFSCSVINIMGT